jgi:hypothetical protein
MKKCFLGVVIALAVALSAVVSVFAEEPETAKWSPNSPIIDIFEDDIYWVDYNRILTEHIESGGTIRLLMIDGGFVPSAGIVIENGRTLVPLRLISETFGAKVDFQGRRVVLTDGETEIILTIGSRSALVNGEELTLDSPTRIIGSSTYVPLRFIADSFGADVNYIPEMTYGLDIPDDAHDFSWKTLRKRVSLTVIEKGSKSESTITVEDGLTAALEASAEEYDALLAYLSIDNRDIADAGGGEYDSQAITYAGFDIGRYYVYQLKDWELYPIFINKYTGEMFSESTGLPFISWGRGFPNIGWLYQ